MGRNARPETQKGHRTESLFSDSWGEMCRRLLARFAPECPDFTLMLLSRVMRPLAVLVPQFGKRLLGRSV
jgi:hypothetical protein